MPPKNILKLFELRTDFSAEARKQKQHLLEKLELDGLNNKKTVLSLYDTLLFLMAYADSEQVYNLAEARLNELRVLTKKIKKLRIKLYNSGVTGSDICAQFSFEIVKWLRERFGNQVTLDSIAAPEGQVGYLLSVVLPHVESEILQDENTTWQEWLKQGTRQGEDRLDTLLNIFGQSDIQPDVKDELWNAMSMFFTIKLTKQVLLPDNLVTKYYHQSLIKKGSLNEQDEVPPVEVKLSQNDAQYIIDAARMTLVIHSREFDPISFTEPIFVKYYHLQRGLTIALLGMRHERRHPIDCYMGYMVFKNGLPVSYGGSWILFDSTRIALNIFPSYRGGESAFIFEQILKVHKHVYRLNRFSVDPYQVGKNNSDGIKSGSFWIYYKFGFRPIRKELLELAEAEAKKIYDKKNYRTPPSVLKKLANGRLELTFNKNTAVAFDATDLSRVYRSIVQEKYAGNRKAAEDDSLEKLIKVLQLNQMPSAKAMQFVMKNWCVILIAFDIGSFDSSLVDTIKKMFLAKAEGKEEEYIELLQNNGELRRLVETVVDNNREN